MIWRLSASATAEWCSVIRVMVCARPPGSAGRAPQASRHSITPAAVEVVANRGAGIWDGAREPHPANAEATPAPPATARRRRRLSRLLPRTDPTLEGAPKPHPDKARRAYPRRMTSIFDRKRTLEQRRRAVANLFDFVVKGGIADTSRMPSAVIDEGHKSTVHRFVVNLEAAGFLERDPRSTRYRLGLRIFELGGLVMQQMNLWDEALPFLEGLVRDTGETGHLAVLDGGEAIYVERVEARRALRVPSAIGRGYPAHATNLGKALLAHLGREELHELVGRKGLPAYTPNTITDLESLERELELIRAQGFAVDNEEYDEGLRCVGAAPRPTRTRAFGGAYRAV